MTTHRRNDYRVYARGSEPAGCDNWWVVVLAAPRGNHGFNHTAARAARKAYACGWWISPRDALEMAWRVTPLGRPL